MHKKFEVNRTKIKGGCQSGRKVVTNDSKSYLLLVPSQVTTSILTYIMTLKKFILKILARFNELDASDMGELSDENAQSARLRTLARSDARFHLT